MAIIREPDGVDFTVINRTLSEEEKKEISEYIRKDKSKRAVPRGASMDIDHYMPKLMEVLEREPYFDWNIIEKHFKEKQMIYSLFQDKDQDGISLFLKCHLLLENYTITYLERELSAEIRNIDNLNFSQKVKKLPSNRLEISLLKPAMLEVNKVRNRLAHNIVPFINNDDLTEIRKVLSLTRTNRSYDEPISMLKDFLLIVLVFMGIYDSRVKEVFDKASTDIAV